jgi:hypothetical protein
LVAPIPPVHAEPAPVQILPHRILGGADLTGDFIEVQRLNPGAGGETSIPLPAVGPSRFFLVEELP